MPYNNLVLVADDNHDLVETTCELLTLFGVNARPCFSGLEAISLAQDLRPEVVILDIGMPSPDGFATFSIIRALHGCSTVPILAVTAYSDPEHSQQIRDKGFAAHLVKPVNIEVLAATVRRLAEVEASKAWDCAGRYDALSAQRLEVALVYKEMLGDAEARKYLESVAMSSTLIDRVLDSRNHRI
jgi:CheY-like chemotaxis protein